MSFDVSGFAPALLIGLEQAAKENNAMFKQTPVGTLEALQTPENASAEIKAVDQGNGHRVGVRIKYIPRSTTSEVQTSRDCTAEAEKAYQEEDVTLDTYRQVKVGLSADTIAKYTKEASDMVATGNPNTPIMREVSKRILLKINALRTSINQALVTDISNSFGINVVTGSSAVKDVQMIANGSTGIVPGTPVYQGLQELLFDYVANEMVGRPMVIGYGNFSKFNTAVQKFGGQQNSGLQLSGMASEYNFFPDLTSDAILGANQLAVIAPGTAQFISWNLHRGDFAGQHGGTVLFVMPDPMIPNLFYDVQLDFDSCTKQWNLIIGLNFTFWNQPGAAFQYPDRLVGVNGLFRYRATAA